MNPTKRSRTAFTGMPKRRLPAKRLREPQMVHRVLLMPVVVVAASALVALGLFPAFGGVGKAITRFDRQFLGANDKDLTIPAFPQRSTIYAADGSVLATVADYNRRYVPLKEVNETTRQAVLAIEDDGFYTHGAVNAFSILRAALINLKAGHVVQGGSTITQQLIKNTETGNAETFSRKFREAQDAIRLERQYTKDQILELYLNEVYLGHGAYGIGSAAEYYFAREPNDLTLPQAAMLAGLISSPARWDPVDHRDDAIARRNQVLARMHELGWISTDAYDQAVTSPIKLSRKLRNVNALGPEPYFVRYVEDTILHPLRTDPNFKTYLKIFGKTYDQRRTALFQGGLKIYTTLQPKMQAEAADAVETRLPNQGQAPPKDPEAAVVSVVPQTGAIQAMYGGTDFSKQQFNLATQSRRTAGSSFKAFTLAAALTQGVPVGKVYKGDSPVTIPNPECFTNGTPWQPANAEGGISGYINMATATADSINVWFAQLIADIGPQSVADIAEQMGVQPYVRGSVVNVPAVCAITLGAVEVNPLSMTSGYATLANMGVHCYPFAIRRVVSSTGKTLFKSKPSCEQVLDPKVAAQETSLLEGVISSGTGTAAQIGRPEAGKTGTGQDYQDAWFMGYIPQLVTGVWVGYSKDEIPMRDLPVLGGGNAFGGTIAAPIWHDYMIKAAASLPLLDFPPAPAGKSGTVPDVVGKKQQAAEDALAKANFTAIPKDVACAKPVGIVCSQSPAGGSVAPLGSGVTINVSNGKPPKVTVPSVVGMTKTSAENRLENQGLVVSVTFQKVANLKNDGIVLSQNPSGGASVQPGATVAIVVGRYGPSPSPSPTKAEPEGGNTAAPAPSPPSTPRRPRPGRSPGFERNAYLRDRSI
jgi:penicillin-binding protein 1A